MPNLILKIGLFVAHNIVFAKILLLISPMASLTPFVVCDVDLLINIIHLTDWRLKGWPQRNITNNFIRFFYFMQLNKNVKYFPQYFNHGLRELLFCYIMVPLNLNRIPQAIFPCIGTILRQQQCQIKNPQEYGLMIHVINKHLDKVPK